MARSWFGATPADVATTTAGKLLRIVPNAVITLWSAQTGGTQYTDLLLAGSPVTAITADAGGLFPRFQGPDAVGEMWADSGGPRVLLRAIPLTVIVPVGTTGYAAQPDGTLWIEYTP